MPRPTPPHWYPVSSDRAVARIDWWERIDGLRLAPPVPEADVPLVIWSVTWEQARMRSRWDPSLPNLSTTVEATSALDAMIALDSRYPLPAWMVEAVQAG